MKVRKKPNQKEINDKIDADFSRRFSFFFDGKNKVEFILPKKNNLNNMLFNNLPSQNVTPEGIASKNGEYGQIKIFYFESSQKDKLHSIFNEFYIPENLYPDLTLAFLSMVFAATTSKFIDKIDREQNDNKTELVKLIDLIEELIQHKYSIGEVKLYYSEVLKETKPDNTLKLGKAQEPLIIKGTLALNLLRKALYNYKNVENYESFRWYYDFFKEHGIPDRNMGHKNSEKQEQSYYSIVLFDYLRRELFRPVHELYCKPETEGKYQNEFKKAKEKYSHVKMYLFIGRLMYLAGLLKIEENVLSKVNEKNFDDSITDLIRKKIAPKLLSEKKRDQLIDEMNAKIENEQDIDSNFI